MKILFKVPKNYKDKIFKYNNKRVMLIRSTYETTENLAITTVAASNGSDHDTITTNFNINFSDNNVAYIKNDENLINFIKENNIGKPVRDGLPITFGFNQYLLYEFDLNKTITYEEYENMFTLQEEE